MYISRSLVEIKKVRWSTPLSIIALRASDILISKTKTIMIDFSNTETKTNTKMIMKTETI